MELMLVLTPVRKNRLFHAIIGKVEGAIDNRERPQIVQGGVAKGWKRLFQQRNCRPKT